MIKALQAAGAGINIHVIRDVLNDLVCARPKEFGRYIDLQVSRSSFRSLYCRMKFPHRAVITSRPTITKSLWVELRSQFLQKITQKALQYNIPNELIINADQMPSKFNTTDNITMAAQGEKHVSRRGATHKREKEL